jgi:hypothetical protein
MLGDKVIVTTTTGPGKTETQEIEVRIPGGKIEVKIAADGLLWVTVLTRKGRPRQRLIVNPGVLVVLREEPR